MGLRRPQRILSDQHTFLDFTRMGCGKSRSKGPFSTNSAIVFIEWKAAALRAASLLKHEATENKNRQSQHAYRNQHPSGHCYYLLCRLRSRFCGAGCASPESTRAGFCSGATALDRERISIQTSRAMEMAVNPPTRMCETSMGSDLLFRLFVRV